MKKLVIICLIILSICGCMSKTKSNETNKVENSKEKLYQVYVEDYDYSGQAYGWNYNDGNNSISFMPHSYDENGCLLSIKLDGVTYMGECKYNLTTSNLEIDYKYNAFYNGVQIDSNKMIKINGTFPINLKTITINFNSQEFELINNVYNDLKNIKGYNEIFVRESDDKVFNLNGKAIDGTCSKDDCNGNYDYEQINLDDYEILLVDVKLDEDRIPVFRTPISKK